MRVILLILILLVAAPVSAEYPFMYYCLYENDAQRSVCQNISKSVIKTGKVGGKNEKNFYILTVLMHERDDNIAVSLVIDYMNKDCGGFLVDTFQGTLLVKPQVDKSEDYDEYFRLMVEKFEGWVESNRILVDKKCGQMYITAGGINGS